MVDTYLNSIAANGFDIFCDNPTRVTETSSSSLDNFLFQKIKEGQVLQHQKFSDHYPVQFKFRIHKTTTKMKKCLDIQHF